MKIPLIRDSHFQNLTYLETLLNDMFNKFFENDLFNSTVFEANVKPIKTHAFKSTNFS